jgi:WD40 repeat protein
VNQSRIKVRKYISSLEVGMRLSRYACSSMKQCGLLKVEQLWECTTGGPSIVHTFTCSQGAVLSIAVRDSDTIYVGCQDGYVKVWDLETKTLIRTLIVQEV